MEKVNQQNVSFYKFNDLKIPNGFLGKEYNFLSSFSKEELSLQYEKAKEVVGTDKIAFVHQIHSNKVKLVTKENYLQMDACDGLLTNEKGIALATRVADCQAILLYDEVKQVIGNIHSGWKGTLGRIVIHAISLMKEYYGCDRKDIKVFFCPSICQDCFEVKDDVYQQFKDTFIDIDVDKYIRYSQDTERFSIDTIGINEELLVKKGILKENIVKSNLCTKCLSTSFHSYRVDKEDTGRNLAILSL